LPPTAIRPPSEDNGAPPVISITAKIQVRHLPPRSDLLAPSKCVTCPHEVTCLLLQYGRHGRTRRHPYSGQLWGHGQPLILESPHIGGDGNMEGGLRPMGGARAIVTTAGAKIRNSRRHSNNRHRNYPTLQGREKVPEHGRNLLKALWPRAFCVGVGKGRKRSENC
jgi:hypothetical protein